MTQGFKVEYNMPIGMGVWSGWAAHDPVFDTEDEAYEFIRQMMSYDHEGASSTEYRVVPA